MGASNDDKKKTNKKTVLNPEMKPTATGPPSHPPSTNPLDHDFKKPLNLPRSSRKTLSGTTQNLTAPPALKRPAPAPTPPSSKKPSPPTKKPFPLPTPPPSPPPTPPPTPPSPPKRSGVSLSEKKRSASCTIKRSSSAPKAPPPKRPTSLPICKRAQPALNLKQIVSPSPPLKVRAAPTFTVEGSILARGPPPGAKRSPPPPIPATSTELSQDSLRISSASDQSGSWLRNYIEKLQAQGTRIAPMKAPAIPPGKVASPETPRTKVASKHVRSKRRSRTPSPKKKGPKTPPRPERPRNPALGRAVVWSPSEGEMVDVGGAEYEVVEIRDYDSDTRSPVDTNVTSTTGQVSSSRKKRGLNFFSRIRHGLELPPPFATSQQCMKCRKNEREECKNCHQLQPICRMCPCCGNYRHFACFEDGCYNPSYWLQWICRSCSAATKGCKKSDLRYNTMNRSFGMLNPEEVQGRHSEYQEGSSPAGKENTPPGSNANKRRLKLDIPQLREYEESLATAKKKLKKSTTPGKKSLTPKKSLVVSEDMSTPTKTPTKKSSVQKNKALESSPKLFKSTPTKSSFSPKASIPRTPTSPQVSTSRTPTNPHGSTSSRSVSSNASTSSRFSVLQEISPSRSSKMCLSSQASPSRMPLGPRAATSSTSATPKDSTRMSPSPKARASSSSASPTASTSRMSTPPENTPQGEIRLPLSLDFDSPDRMVTRCTGISPEVPVQLLGVSSKCEHCKKIQPIMKHCFMCDGFVNGFACKSDECWLEFSGKIDLLWYCSSCIRNFHIPQVLLENFCYACLTPMPLAKNCHNCDKFYFFHCDFPYKCIVTRFPSHMMTSRWNHCEECLDDNRVGNVEPLKVARLMTNLEAWHVEIISIPKNVYDDLPTRRYPSVKRTLNLDEADDGDSPKKIHLKRQ